MQHPRSGAASFNCAASVALCSAGGGNGLVWDVSINPPLVLHNALPVPVDVTLRSWAQESALPLLALLRLASPAAHLRATCQLGSCPAAARAIRQLLFAFIAGS